VTRRSNKDNRRATQQTCTHRRLHTTDVQHNRQPTCNTTYNRRDIGGAGQQGYTWRSTGLRHLPSWMSSRSHAPCQAVTNLPPQAVTNFSIVFTVVQCSYC